MKKVLAIATTFLFAACGASVPTVATKGVTDEKTAAQAVGAVNTALGKMIQGITPARATASANFKVACDSGSASVTVTATSDGSGSGSGEYNFTFNACAKGTDKISGTMKWSFTVGSGSGKIVFDGNIAYEGANYAGNFNFNALTISYSGTDYTITGSYTIGGTTYAVTKDNASGIFGGGA